MGHNISFAYFCLKTTKTAKMRNSWIVFWKVDYAFSVVTPISWTSETIPGEVTAILTLLNQKMEKFTISPQYRILTENSIFYLWTRSSLSYLSLKTLTIFLPFLVHGSTQCSSDSAMMFIAHHFYYTLPMVVPCSSPSL